MSDVILVMLYDQHWLTSEPGPISAPDWVARSLAARVAGPPEWDMWVTDVELLSA